MPKALADIKTHEASLLKNKSAANQLIALIELASPDAPASVVIAATQSLRRVLIAYDADLALARKPSAAADAADAEAAVNGAAAAATATESAETKLHGWLHGKFKGVLCCCTGGGVLQCWWLLTTQIAFFVL